MLRGPLGFGRSSALHTTKILRLSGDLPLVIEIVDSEASIGAFLDAAAPLLRNILVTVENLRVVEFDEP